jgi:hypothetical protein
VEDHARHIVGVATHRVNLPRCFTGHGKDEKGGLCVRRCVCVCLCVCGRARTGDDLCKISVPGLGLVHAPQLNLAVISSGDDQGLRDMV